MELKKDTTIVGVRAENVKGLEFVELSFPPGGGLTIISGDNGEGKSSFIDAMEYAIREAGALPSEPLRKGTDSGYVELLLDDLVIRRTFKRGAKPTLEVRGRDGAKYSSPRALLDALYEKISFHPLEFAYLPPREQRELLLDLTGMRGDIERLEAKRRGVYDDRATVNRTVRELENALPSFVELEGAAPLDEKKAATLQEAIAAGEKQKARRDIAEGSARRIEEELRTLEDRMAQLKKSLAVELELAATDAPNIAGMREELDAIREADRRHKANAERAKMAAMLDECRQKSDALTAQLEAIEGEKLALLQKANLPVPGLSITDEGLAVDGVPLDQMSSSEKLGVAVALTMATPRPLKTIFVREGALLDAHARDAILHLAEERGFRVFMEVVGEEPATVVFRDGRVVEGTASNEPQI